MTPSVDPVRLLLIGGSSEIGLAIARRLIEERPLRAVLLGRHRTRLEDAAAALRQAGAVKVEVEIADADAIDCHEQAVGRAFDRLNGADVIVLAVGVLGAQAGLAAPPEEAMEVLRVNFLGAGSLLWHALVRLRAQGSGTMVVLSSVAAERPRASNAVYAAAKAGLDALAQGLADAGARSGVRVLVVRPGFVTTRMTAGLKRAPMHTTAEAVAETVAKALAGRAHTVWVPARLRIVFSLLRHLPRWLFRRLPL